MKLGTHRVSNGILTKEKMFDPTQTQPLSWRMQQGKAVPLEEGPIDPPGRQEPSFDSAPPERLAERGYRLRARIGSGRLGSIFEAQDELSRISGSQHLVAIQLIDEKVAARPGFAAEFERGAAELKSISHPNIVRLLEYGREQNRYFLVNELLESASLRFVLNDVNVLPAEETTAVVRAVGDALQYLHAKGMAHGNLRPENVLVTFGYEVKLLDIVPNGWLVNPTDALGVPERAPDKRDDVFGLACLAYEMLAGRHPYNGNTAQEAHRAGLEAAPIEGMAARQWRALSDALAVHRDDRTPNVAQFLDEFGVTGMPKLRAVVAAGNEPRPFPSASEAPAAYAPAPPPAYAPAPASAPGYPPRVVAERARPRKPHRSAFGTLFVLLALIGVGAAVWYYQEPLGGFATDLMERVDTEMARSQAADDRASQSTTADVPLTKAPVVTDDTPATVLAPGANEPAAPETAQAQATAPAPEAQAPAAASVDRASAADSADRAPAERAATARPQQSAPADPVPEPAAPTPVAPPQAAPAAPPQAAPAAGPTRFSFQQSAVTVRESDVAARIMIRRSGDLSGTAEVSWWTADGSAVADRDYADLGARIERFAPGEASRTVYVPITNDTMSEPARNFSVLLGRGGDAASEIRVNIVDDD
jgi:serine/threonine protein kinase